MRAQKQPDEWEELEGALTVAEAAQLFNVTRGTIHYHIIEGNVAARQSGAKKTWLVSRLSLARLYKDG